jgi:hypothetical protein
VEADNAMPGEFPTSRSRRVDGHDGSVLFDQQQIIAGLERLATKRRGFI